ncbi:dUTP diphosphatase [Erwinia phage Cronus]|uniref:dCTP pyrophosphatase n=1 Tax=Erwinia phage Cronus TaxID=2163633 RepID=A0A2S1GM50_9CAUD|nr:dUTP diphosphatase [Erwinia phage Cronus]AWD90460.1 dCTP pyrophosphatase [Erwinia phage Cronus]
MAHFNECSQLIAGADKATAEYDYALQTAKDPLQIMLDMQKSLQVRLANDRDYCYHPDKLKTAGDVVGWMREQKDCIDDEFRELLTSLGEMHRGDKDASAVWKKWKGRYVEAQNKPISEMSSEDQLEIKFELIDIMHFVFNMAIGLNMSAEEMFKLYYLKNAENFARQDNGY